jgi:dolichol kinase
MAGMLELRRQFVHALFGIAVAALVLAVGREFAVIALTGFLFLGMLAINLELRGRKSVFSGLFGKFERERVAPGKGALNYAVGALFLLAFAPSVSFAVGILLILAVADAFSTVVGVRLGSRKRALFWNRGKSWEGLLAFVVTGFIASFYFLGLPRALFYSVVLAVVEALDFGVDDNLLIPVAAILLNFAIFP